MDDLERDALDSNEEFVAHFRATYEEFPKLPLWAAAETMTFGSMFTLFKMSNHKIRRAVAHRYDLADPVLLSWLKTLLYVRNLCAHHARLWNRELAVKPMLPDLRNGPLWHSPIAIANRRVFVVLTMLNYLLEYVAPQTGWKTRLFTRIDAYPEIPLHHMGIPPTWRTHPLWMPPPAPAPTGIFSTRQPKNAKFPEF
jgi:abortive infection bacteriophage resistance protein